MATIYIDGVKSKLMAIGTTEIANILKGTSDPSSSIGSDGQLYLKYGSYEKHYFMDNKIVVVENKNDATDLKLYIVGLTKDSSGIAIMDTDLLAYLSDITSGYLKACCTYDTADSTTQTGLLAIGDWGSGMTLHTYIPGWTQYKAGTFYGVIDLTESPVPASGYPTYQENPFVDPDTIVESGILNSFAKVNNQWQNLIGTDIDAIQSGGEPPVVPFEKEILHSILQDQPGSTVPVSVTFTKDYQIAFVCGLIADNVGTGAISVNALGGASTLYGEYWERYVSAGIAIQLPSNKTLTGYFPYSDGGAYYDIFGAIGMSRLPSEYEVGATIDVSNISIELSKVYDHIVVFVGMNSNDSNSMTLAMNGASIPLTVESEKFSRYSYHASKELTSDSTTLNFTYSGGTVNDNTIVVFAYNE